MLKLFSSLIVPNLDKLVGVLNKALTLIFVYRQGKKDVELKSAREGLKDAKEASKVKSNITSLSDDDLDKLL